MACEIDKLRRWIQMAVVKRDNKQQRQQQQGQGIEGEPSARGRSQGSDHDDNPRSVNPDLSDYSLKLYSNEYAWFK